MGKKRERRQIATDCKAMDVVTEAVSVGRHGRHGLPDLLLWVITLDRAQSLQSVTSTHHEQLAVNDRDSEL